LDRARAVAHASSFSDFGLRFAVHISNHTSRGQTAAGLHVW